MTLSAVSKEEISNSLKMELLKLAEEKHPGQEIMPCRTVGDFNKCFTISIGKAMFWYDFILPNGGRSTGTVYKDLN